MAHSSVLLKEQFSSKLEKGLRWQMNGRRLLGRQCWALRLLLLLSRDDSSSGLSGGWSSSGISSGPACELSHDLATPHKARHPWAGAGNASPAVLCAWAALGGCSHCLWKMEIQCLWEGTMSVKHSHWQVFWKDTEWLPASSSWSDHPVVVLMRFPHWCFVYAEHKQWHTMCGPRRSERVSTEPNLGWIRACYGMYIDVTFVLQRCNIWIMMSWYAR